MSAPLLSQYLHENPVTEAELARLLKCSQSTVSRLRCGRRPPGRALAARIERALGIPASGWDPPEVVVDHVPEALRLLSEAYPEAEGGWSLDGLEVAAMPTLDEQVTEVARAKLEALVPVVVERMTADPARWALVQFADDVARAALTMPLEDALSAV